MTINLKRLAFLTTGVAALSFGLTAHSQEATEESVDNEARLKTITVVAQKREENLQDVPISIAAFNQEIVEAPGASDITSLNGLIPNVVLQPQALIANVPAIAIRGMSHSDPDPLSDPKTSTFIDGVYVGFAAGTMMDMFDIERVEVLKGPQGTLFGRNNLAGTVNIISSRPQDEFGGAIRITAGDNGLRQGRFKIDTGRFMNDLLAAKLAVNVKEYDGYVRNIITGTNLNTADVVAFRGALRFNPNDRIQSDLTFDNLRDKTMGPGHFLVNNGSAGYNAVPAIARGDVRLTALNFDPWTTTTSEGLAWQTDIEIGEGTLTAVLGQRDLTYGTLGDFDGIITPEPGFKVTRDFAGESQSAEIRYASPGGGKFDYVVGAFLSEDKFDQINNVLTSATVRTQSFLDQDSQSQALFAQGNLHFADFWTLTLGGRYTEDEKDYRLRVLATTGATTVTSFDGRLNSSWSNFNPRVALVFKPNDNLNLYAYYATGYKAGGFNARGTVAENVGPYDEELVTTYEAGVKGNLFGGNVRYEAAIFQNEFEDLQFSTTRIGAQRPEAVTTHVAGAETRGFELNLQWAPTENLTAGLNFGYLDAAYTDFCADTDGVFSTTTSAVPRQCGPAREILLNGAPTTPRSYEIPIDTTNLPMPNAPPYSGSVMLDYERGLGTGTIGGHVDLRYTDEYMVGGRTIEPGFFRGSVILMNGNITLSANENWEFKVFGQNLTDEVVLIGQNRGTAATPIMQFYGAPREFGVEATFKW